MTTPPAAPPVINLSRRAVLAGSGALVLGVHLPGWGVGEAAAAVGANTLIPVNAWLKISATAVSVVCPASEMGQGVFTALAQLVAEELDIDWRIVRAEMAPFDAAYANPILGGMRSGGATSIRAWFLPMRRAGAAARLMLKAAAAEVWRVAPDSLVLETGLIRHPPSAREASYGALAQVASRQAVPAEPPLRDPARWTLIGQPVPRLDVPDKVAGRALFGMDVLVPGQLYAAIRHCPVYGGTLARLDDSALKMGGGSYPPGVVSVVTLKDAVAVVAEDWWLARSALARVAVAWAEGANAGQNSAAIDSALARALDPKDPRAVATVVNRGDVDRAIAGSARSIDAVYRLPFLAHAALEPLNATASVTARGCELWLPTQDQGQYPRLLAEALGIRPDKVRVNTTYVGGSFGRRFEADVGLEAALLSKAVGRPVQLIWTREEDIRHDVYRPASISRVTLGLDVLGRITGWRHRVAAPSILGRVAPGALRDGVDKTATQGVADQPYPLPALRLDYVRQETGIPVGFWRSVGHGSNGFVVESMIDEAAAALGRDPWRFRRDLLAEKAPRALRVLDLAAAKAGWTTPLPPIARARRGRGIALHEAYGSVIAAVVEVTVFFDGRVGLDRVVAALDCGQMVNPDIVSGQVAGGLLFGLGAALTGRVGFERGRALQSNFHDYKILTLAEAPPVEVHLVASAEPPGGVSEAGVPPAAPALTNAIFAATGKRLRALPVAAADLSGA
ncbi:MAG: xanthine dehydrogenase family protein molybdopterin-binding subunit [Rhodospirillaceae bacterium]